MSKDTLETYDAEGLYSLRIGLKIEKLRNLIIVDPAGPRQQGYNDGLKAAIRILSGKPLRSGKKG